MNISTNAIHYFPQPFQAGRLCLLDVSGTFGGASVTPGYMAGDGQFTPNRAPDGSASVAITTRGGFEVRTFREGKVGIQVTGGTWAEGEHLVLDVIAAVDMPPGS